MNRIEHVTARLTDMLHDIGCVAQPLSKFEWLNTPLADPSNLHRMYGWVPPFLVDGPHPVPCLCSACDAGASVETVVGAFSPELIAEQTAFLDDRHFEAYVDTIHWSFSMHILHRHLPWDEKEALVDKAMYDVAEDSMVLQNDVQMFILEGCRQ